MIDEGESNWVAKEVGHRLEDLVVMTELAILRGKSRTKTNPKGWIINALKGKIKDK